MMISRFISLTEAASHLIQEAPTVSAIWHLVITHSFSRDWYIEECYTSIITSVIVSWKIKVRNINGRLLLNHHSSIAIQVVHILVLREILEPSTYSLALV